MDYSDSQDLTPIEPSNLLQRGEEEKYDKEGSQSSKKLKTNEDIHGQILIIPSTRFTYSTLKKTGGYDYTTYRM